MFYSRFLELYGRPNRLTLPERNPKKRTCCRPSTCLPGQVYTEKLGQRPVERLQSMLHAGKNDSEIVREIYLAAYTRSPEPQELQQVLQLIAAEPKSRRRAEGLRMGHTLLARIRGKSLEGRLLACKPPVA